MTELLESADNLRLAEVVVSMSEVVLFLAEQSLVVRTAMYVASLLALSFVGGFTLSFVIEALDKAGAALTAKRDWDVLSALSSKEDVLQLFAVAAYSAILIAAEPAIRSLASAVGSALVTSLVLAPVAGLIVLSSRKPA